MIRNPAFPAVPADQMVGSMDGRRFMESYCDQTLRGISRGQIGEPPHIISLAKSILKERASTKAAPAYPPTVRTDVDKINFRRWLEQANESPNRALKHSAIMLLENTFGYHWHKEDQS